MSDEETPPQDADEEQPGIPTGPNGEQLYYYKITAEAEVIKADGTKE